MYVFIYTYMQVGGEKAAKKSKSEETALARIEEAPEDISDAEAEQVGWFFLCICFVYVLSQTHLNVLK